MVILVFLHPLPRRCVLSYRTYHRTSRVSANKKCPQKGLNHLEAENSTYLLHVSSFAETSVGLGQLVCTVGCPIQGPEEMRQNYNHISVALLPHVGYHVPGRL